MKKRFSEEQIIGFLREAEAGMSIKDLCRQPVERPWGSRNRPLSCRIRTMSARKGRDPVRCGPLWPQMQQLWSTFPKHQTESDWRCVRRVNASSLEISSTRHS
ncbi:hypothetical protein EKT70_15450 [Stenotrophomonas geniculata]|nr:hypothetical protein EKT70_15450 [Stenotrophomonas geniculata]